MSKSKIYAVFNNTLFKSFALSFFTLIVLHIAGYVFLRHTISNAPLKGQVQQAPEETFLIKEKTEDRAKVLRP